MKKKIIRNLLQLGGFRWIVVTDSSSGSQDIGFRVFGINVTYYKWADTPIVNLPGDYREANKREFDFLGNKQT